MENVGQVSIPAEIGLGIVGYGNPTYIIVGYGNPSYIVIGHGNLTYII